MNDNNNNINEQTEIDKVIYKVDYCNSNKIILSKNKENEELNKNVTIYLNEKVNILYINISY